MDRQETRSILMMFVLAFPQFELTEERLDLWVELLKDTDFRFMRPVAIKYLKSDHQFPPTPGQLLSEADKLLSLKEEEDETNRRVQNYRETVQIRKLLELPDRPQINRPSLDVKELFRKFYEHCAAVKLKNMKDDHDGNS